MKEALAAAKPEDSKYDKWAVENAMRTLAEAAEIRKDPKMMKLIAEKAKTQLKAVTSIEDLEEAYNDEVSKEEDAEEEEEA